MTARQISPQEYDDFRRYLEEHSGIVLGDNKHYLVTSRLNRLMREFDLEDFATLMKRLKGQRNSKLHEQIVDAMTTNETLWFRDAYPFEVLKYELLPQITANKLRQVRIWSAASSSGQEAYSISMTIQEYLASKPGSLPGNLQIIGTDISATMLRDASSATYDKMSLARGISEERRQRFFIPAGDKWQVRPEIKARTSFRELNLLNNFSALGKFDIIFCRNVLIYFSSEMKRDILNRMATSLNPGGHLFLGGSESPTSYTDAFEMVRTPKGVVYRVKESAHKGNPFSTRR
ncbi:MAG: protein-glutamate O-methyltransferase CheR [Gammaproteobacteria bacterium]|nr:protein-glutamate O-methyltransferase CheR [Gammaproteobacteria bacterium]